MLVPTLALILAAGAEARRACPRYFWRGQCTACPGYWYQSCGGGNSDANQRGCGFLGCETQCLDPDGNGYDLGCGCDKGEACKKKDCVVEAWGAWGACSKTCGGGQQERTRAVKQAAVYGGAACPVLKETKGCNPQTCAVDCVMNEWSAYGACSKKCGGGVQKSTRTVKTAMRDGGKPCPTDLERTQPCNVGFLVDGKICTPTDAGDQCQSFAWYEELCATRFNAKDCKNAGCSFKKEKCIPKPRGKKMKCKKMDKVTVGERICGCFTGCKTVERKKKNGKIKKVCQGVHSFPKLQQ